MTCRGAVLLVLLLSTAGCSAHTDIGEDPPRIVLVTLTTTTDVDILFVVDHSSGLLEQQSILGDQVGILLEPLLEPSLSGPVADLHVGVITADMGSGGFEVRTCNTPDGGDEGRLQNVGMLDRCEPTYWSSDCPSPPCPWLSSAGHTSRSLGTAFGCIATLGGGGCGLEQPLESTYAALTVQSEPGGHNEGFFRPRSVAVLIFMTDEDDCSAANPSFYDPSNTDLANLNIRCAVHTEHLHPVTRYVHAISALRPQAPSRIVLGAFAAFPMDEEIWQPGDPVSQLQDLVQRDPEDPENLVPICRSDNGLAFASVRVVELVDAFDGVLYSECRSDWSAGFEQMAQRVRGAMDVPCLAEPVDLSRCALMESRSTGEQFEIGSADRDGDGEAEEGLSGFILDRSTCATGRVRLTADVVVEPMSTVAFECVE